MFISSVRLQGYRLYGAGTSHLLSPSRTQASRPPLRELLALYRQQALPGEIRRFWPKECYSSGFSPLPVALIYHCCWERESKGAGGRKGLREVFLAPFSPSLYYEWTAAVNGGRISCESGVRRSLTMCEWRKCRGFTFFVKIITLMCEFIKCKFFVDVIMGCCWSKTIIRWKNFPWARLVLFSVRINCGAHFLFFLRVLLFFSLL